MALEIYRGYTILTDDSRFGVYEGTDIRGKFPLGWFLTRDAAIAYIDSLISQNKSSGLAIIAVPLVLIFLLLLFLGLSWGKKHGRR